jgi:molybdopterin molybdotransferase
LPANDMREDYITARIEAHANQRTLVTPFRGEDGSMWMTLARAGALIRRPAFAPAAQQGDVVDVIHLECSANGL